VKDDPNRLLGTAAIRDDLDISSMTFWRLEHHPDPAVRYPEPDVMIGRKKKWTVATHTKWKADVRAKGLVDLSRKDAAAYAKLSRNAA
jgi:hypothetical protein